LRIGELEDCSKCPVALSQPIEGNDVILDLYEKMPQNFDGTTGLRVITAMDVLTVFRLFHVRRKLWDDYYMRLMHFHGCLRDAVAKEWAKANPSKRD